ncbi:hypothetical protein P3H15_45170 [Rhodococcus sp. T2V]|uniref:hypothetical protein n=1 Tax=Rhodococcus sp. T2V TaxID=3034164 RepID=UPI0023E0C834|nr:hypothetical protein [Rhodococcus sp. T2V]MDF3312165.1 hypothetical protein [Rhodococcus sp. T2V]
MTAAKDTIEQPEVNWGTVVLHQSEPSRAHLAHAVGSTLGVVTAIGAISAMVTTLALVVGGVGAALLHFVWGTVDPARSEQVVADFLDVLPEAGTTLLVTLLLAGGAIGGLQLTGRHIRKHRPARITGAQLEQAPDELRQLMSDAVLAVEEIKGSRAFRDGMFTELDLRAAMWDLGTRVLAAAELQEAITAATDTAPGMLTSDDHQAYTRARTQIEGAAAALRDAADTVAGLDTDLATAEDTVRAEEERGRQLEESSAHVDRLTHAHSAVAATTASPAIAVTDLIETISTRAHAFRNLPRP